MNCIKSVRPRHPRNHAEARFARRHPVQRAADRDGERGCRVDLIGGGFIETGGRDGGNADPPHFSFGSWLVGWLVAQPITMPGKILCLEFVRSGNLCVPFDTERR